MLPTRRNCPTRIVIVVLKEFEAIVLYKKVKYQSGKWWSYYYLRLPSRRDMKDCYLTTLFSLGEAS